MLLLPEGVKLAFCPTGPGGGVDNSCSSQESGTATATLPAPAAIRVGDWPLADRRKLRALQSRLSRATSEGAKEAVRRQIAALRIRVNRASQQILSEEQPATVSTKSVRATNKAAEIAKAKAMLEAYETPTKTSTVEHLAEKAIDAFRTNPYSAKNFELLEPALKTMYPGAEAKDYPRLIALSMGIDDVALKLIEGNGATSSASLRVSVQHWGKGSPLRINVALNHANATIARTLIAGAGAERPKVYNSLFTLSKELQGNGVGVRIFSQQVETLSKGQFSAIETSAARSRSIVGYKVWPKLGYDGPLFNETKAQAKQAGFADEQLLSVQKLLQTEKGQKFWAKSGKTTNMKFSLRKKSPSQEILAKYRARKVAELKAKVGVQLSADKRK